MDFRAKFLNAARRQGWEAASGIVCALSGGGDSVAMLWLMKQFFKGRVVAAHLDHCTREGASHEDASFTRELCAGWGVEYVVKVVDVHACALRGESFEMAGRRARYEHFQETAKSRGLSFIAVGHNADDVVETQLINLARGTGLAGLRGIPERRGCVVRPVIDFTRAELRTLLSENGVAWRDDYTNDQSDYMRNKVRNILIPWIKENMNGGFEGVMLGLARQAEAEAAEKESAARERIAQIRVDMPPAVAAWKVRELAALSDLALSEMLRVQGAALSLPTLSRARTENLVGLIRAGGFWRFQWAKDIEICYSARAMGWLHRADIEKNKKTGKNTCDLSLPWWAR
ncbi:MAG: tRNA lysidine(34) synthetase TilS [Cloacibacillus sp.]